MLSLNAKIAMASCNMGDRYPKNPRLEKGILFAASENHMSGRAVKAPPMEIRNK